jgi:MoaA/NifB/PqqE/SkfB family radical SAM enzyme
VGGDSILFLEVTGQCNERCVHCYAESAPEVTAALDEATCRSVISQAARLGFERVQLTGGDPLLCPFLPELAAHARAEGVAACEVYTNGLALTDERLAKLAASNVEFAMSFYSHDPATHDGRTRVPGSHRRTVEAIKRVLDRGSPLRISVIGIGIDAEHVRRTFDFLVSIGVPAEQISSDKVRTVGRGTEAPAGDDAVVSGRSHSGGASPDTTVKWPGKACVAYTGHVYPCIFSRWAGLGDVRQEPLGAILERARDRRPSVAPVRPDLRARLACFDCRLTAMGLGVAA